MEQADGIPGSMPPLASFPGSKIRVNILPEEWQACLEAWIFAIEFRLRLQADYFRRFKLSDEASGLPFLLTCFSAWGSPRESEEYEAAFNTKEIRLRQQCVLLARRLLLETDLPYDCPPHQLFTVLADGSLAFGFEKVWLDTLKSTWHRNRAQVQEAVQSARTAMINMSTSPTDGYALIARALRQGSALVRSHLDLGMVFMKGSDYVDSLMSLFSLTTTSSGDQVILLQRSLTENLYFCLRSLMVVIPPQSSLLLDHLYSLKAMSQDESKLKPEKGTILSSLICGTSFIRILDIFLSECGQKRGKTLLEELTAYRERTMHLHTPHLGPRSKRKQKGEAQATVDGNIHIHQASQVSQIHELFPDLTMDYTLRLLGHYENDVEKATAALLEPQSLPLFLQNTSAEDELELGTGETIGRVLRTPNANFQQRRNIFDGDDFDNLRISSSKIHMGRKEKDFVTPQSASEHTKSKAAIFSALATFNADDDERDDTYDVADVGGLVDDTIDTDERRPKTRQEDPNEELLFQAYRSTPQIFACDSKTRLSQPRQKIKEESGMTDEQIEGFAVMLQRDSVMKSRLEKKYSVASAFSGQQHTLASSRWHASRSDDDDNDDMGEEDSQPDGQQRQQSGGGWRSGQGGGGFRGRGRGGAARPTAHDANTQAARRRKEQGRGRGGPNHNRREGRARKIRRGMAGGAP